MTYFSLLRSARNLAALAIIASAATACVTEEDTGQDQEELSAETCSGVYSWRECDQDVEPDLGGVQVCVEDESGETVWTECTPHAFDEGPEDCSEGSEWTGSCCMNQLHCCEDDPVCMTPLVLSFDKQPVRFSASSARFDLTRGGFGVATDWPGATTPWLALDRNGNGRIDNGGELFGSATQLSGGSFADNGFVALSQLDSDGDGFITKTDSGWSQLLIWSDHNADRTSDASELSPLADRGLEAIELSYSIATRCDDRGNCEGERARFWFRSANNELTSGSVIDVHLSARR